MVNKKDLSPIGRVARLHGVRGKVKVDYFGDDTAQFHLYREVFIEGERGRLHPYEVLDVTAQPPRLIVQFRDIETPLQAQALVGREIFVRKESLGDLPDGQYYWFEIVGMEVETEEGRRLGTVKEIFPTGANDVYVVQGKKREILLPAVKGVIQSIDREKKVMKVTRMEGLWEREDEV